MVVSSVVVNSFNYCLHCNVDNSRSFSESCNSFYSILALFAAYMWSHKFIALGIRYDSVYLTYSKKLTGSQLGLPHGTNKKLKCETKSKTMSVIGPVQSRCHERSPVGKRSLWDDLLKS